MKLERSSSGLGSIKDKMLEKQRASMDLAPSEVIAKEAHSQTEYAIDMYRQVLKNEKSDNNFVFSPSSIAAALAMTASGAEGATLEQFVSHLKQKDAKSLHQFYLYVHNVILRDTSKSAGPVLGIANGLWVDERNPFNSEFAKYVKTGYGAEAQETNFRLKVSTLFSLI
jgi:serine protease inhibitor